MSNSNYASETQHLKTRIGQGGDAWAAIDAESAALMRLQNRFRGLRTRNAYRELGLELAPADSAPWPS